MILVFFWFCSPLGFARHWVLVATDFGEPFILLAA
jgi:hypothetical protein